MAVCDAAGITHRREGSMVALFREIQAGHHELADLGHRAQDVRKVLNVFASVLDAMIPVRYQASVAHSNPLLLHEPADAERHRVR